jgi:alginate O-acetyltransferase complex protein AlgI
MFASLPFWCACAALFIVIRLIPPENMRLKAAALSVVSVAGIMLVLKPDPVQAMLIALAIGWVLAGLHIAMRRAGNRSLKTALLLIAPVLAAWASGKIFAANTSPWGILFFVGSSYLLVKAFSLIKDRIEGRVTSVDPMVATAYFLYFPAFLSGPMHNYSEFEAALVKPELVQENFIALAFRFVWGLFQVNVLAVLLEPSSLAALVTAETIRLQDVIVGAFFYSGVLYFNFCGYSDMVIATSRGLGIAIPENFDRPYLATSIREFWRRWHITFSRALTAHVFMPVSRALVRALPGRKFLVPAIGYMATFLFAGFWHGATANFLLWGAWHALGLIAQDFSQKLKPRKPGPIRADSFPVRTVKVLATFTFVSAGWILFVLPVDQLVKIR